VISGVSSSSPRVFHDFRCSCHASATAAETRFTGGEDGLRPAGLKWGFGALLGGSSHLVN